MIEAYFGLLRRPFLAVPDIHSYFPSEAMELARTNTLRCLDRGEGISLIFGSSGVGKSLLLRLLGLPFQLDYPIAMISNHRLKSPKAFLQQVLFELQQPFCGSDENELRLLLWDHLRRSSFPGVILLIDEGQTLSLSVLEEIRMMLNCDNGSFPKFRIAIAGTPTFEERLTHPKLKAFNQWIVSRSYLEPFTRSETAEYVFWQSNNARSSSSNEYENLNGLRQSNGELDALRKKISSSRTIRVDSAHTQNEPSVLFDSSACDKIHQYTQGIPRLINQLCDHALVLACENEGRKIIDETAVRAAWSSLQQIPDEEVRSAVPCTISVSDHDIPEKSVENQPETLCPFDAVPDSVVEFGTLDNADCDIAEVDTICEEPLEEIVPTPEMLKPEITEQKHESSEEEEEEENDDNDEEDDTVEFLNEESIFNEFSQYEPVAESETVSCEPAEEDIPWSGCVGTESPQPWIWSEEERPESRDQRLETKVSAASAAFEAESLKDCLPQDIASINTVDAPVPDLRPPASGLQPEYVYQTKTFYESVYPNGPQTALSNWNCPRHRIESGLGTSYREVLHQEVLHQEVLHQAASSTEQTHTTNQITCEFVLPGEVVLPLEMKISETKRGDSRTSLPGFLEISNAAPCDLGQIRLEAGGRRPEEFVAFESQEGDDKALQIDNSINTVDWPTQPLQPHSNFVPFSQPIEYSIPDSILEETEEDADENVGVNEILCSEELSIIRLHFSANTSVFQSERNVLRETFEEEIPIPKTKMSLSESFEFKNSSSRILVKSPHLLSQENQVNNDADKDELELLQQTLLRQIEPGSAERIAALLDDSLLQEESQRNETIKANDIPPVNFVSESESDERMTIRFDPQRIDPNFVPTKSFPRSSKKIVRANPSTLEETQSKENERETILPMNPMQEKSGTNQQSSRTRQNGRNSAVNPDLRSKGKRAPLKLRKPTEEGTDPFEDAESETTSTLPITEKKALDLGSLFSQAYRY